MKGYTNSTEIESYLLKEIDLSFEGQIESWIEAMEAQIDQETGRNFIADASASARLYDGDGSNEIFIDDCVEVESVTIDGAPITVLAYPANSLPYTKIVLATGRFTKGRQNVSVTAKWGYSVDVPADIKFACTVLVAGIINNSTTSEGEVQSMTMGSYQISYKSKKEANDFENVKASLAKYQRMDV
jgi:hypothetical protein